MGGGGRGRALKISGVKIHNLFSRSNRANYTPTPASQYIDIHVLPKYSSAKRGKDTKLVEKKHEQICGTAHFPQVPLFGPGGRTQKTLCHIRISYFKYFALHRGGRGEGSVLMIL